MNQVTAEHRLRLGIAEQETSGSDRKQPDIIIRDHTHAEKVLLVVELKNPEFHVFSEVELIEPARKKASKRRAPYFATCNFRELVWFNTEQANRMEPLEKQIVQRYILSDLTDPDEIEDPAIRSAIWRGLERFLQDLSEISTGIKTQPLHAIDELLVFRLQSIISVLTVLYRQIVKVRCEADPTFAARLRDWFRDQGWSFLGQREDYDKAARQTAYLLVNKILFYDAVQPIRRLDPLEIPKSLTRGSVLQSTLQGFFQTILKIDYETIYSADFIDQIAFPDSVAVVEAIKELIEMLGRYDFSKIGYDVIGRIFEKLIPSDERHILGQYFTSPDVVDLILRGCLSADSEVVLDPSCGAGTFLVRAYQHKKLRNQRLSHEEILRTLWGTDIAKFPAHLATINLAVNDLRSNENYPRVIKRDFFDLMPADLQFPVPEKVEEVRGLGTAAKVIDRPAHFDCITGNPPYTRHLEIEEIQDERGHSYKDEVIRKALLGPDGKNLAEISRRAGIYAYFFVHATKFLREGGKFGFVVSNAWLDADYGKGLQEHFLTHYKMLAIIESKVERWFEDAEINTAIVLLEKCSGAEKDAERNSNLVRFAYLFKPLRHFIPAARGGWSEQVKRVEAIDALLKTIFAHAVYYENEELRVFPKLQGDLFVEGFDSKRGRYDGAKWGVYVRAPRIFFKLQSHALQRLRPLRDFATIGEGKPTGAEEFFFPTEEAVRKFELEEEFLQPGILKARGFYSLELAERDLSHRFLAIEKDREALKRRHVLNYIRAGEREHLHLRNTFTAKKEWYRLSRREPGTMILSRGIGERHYCIFNSAKAVASGSFSEITVTNRREARALWMFLNSAVGWLFMELSGRRQMGGGMLKLDPTDLRKMLVVPPGQIPDSLITAIEPLQHRTVHKIRDEMSFQDRQRFDQAVLADVFGLGEPELTEMYAAINDLVASRISKARSVRQDKTRVDSVDLSLVADTILSRIQKTGLFEAIKNCLVSENSTRRSLPRKTRSLSVTRTLYGWNVRVDEHVIECADENSAQLVATFVDLGFESIAIPLDSLIVRKHLSTIKGSLSLANEILHEAARGLVQPKMRLRLNRTVWEKARQIILASISQDRPTLRASVQPNNHSPSTNTPNKV